MAVEHKLVRRGLVNLAGAGGGALKKAAKKAAGKKAAGKKAAGKGAKHVPKDRAEARAFHHLQRAAAVISLLEGESGGDLRMLLEEGVGRYRRGEAGAVGLLRAAEHLGMAGLYAARASHRLDVEAPATEEVGRKLDRVAIRVDALGEGSGKGFAESLPEIASELLGRAEGALDEDAHLAWELVMAAEGICEGLEEG